VKNYSIVALAFMKELYYRAGKKGFKRVEEG